MAQEPSHDPQSKDSLDDLAAVVSNTRRTATPPGLPPAPPFPAEQNPYAATQVTALPPSLVPSVIGACAGAGLGAAIWILVGYLANMEIGFVAILAGALAGWGAVWMGKHTSHRVGIVAALAGAVAIFLGSYGNFYLAVRSGEGKEAAYRAFEKEAATNSKLPQLTKQEGRKVFDELYDKEFVSKVSYLDVTFHDGKGMAYLALFGGLGIYYGYRVGSGTTRKRA
jgi:hypothetical protein